MEEKPTFYQLCVRHGINVLSLEKESRVDPLLIWDALTGNAITEQVARQLLDAFNVLCGTQYTLDDVARCLVQSVEESSLHHQSTPGQRRFLTE